MEAKRDENRITTAMGAFSGDGKTPQLVRVNSLLKALCVSNGTTGSDFSVNNSVRDENRIPVLMAVSSSDGVTPVEVYADSLFNLLVKST